METTKVVCNKEFQIDRVDSRLFGSFLEHMGRVIYSGIYEPDNKNADEDGFRQDVIDRVKEMNVTTVRYPGGNFVQRGLERLARRQYRALAQELGVSRQEVLRAEAQIRALDPRPGAAFAPREEPVYLVPDLVVLQGEHGLEVHLQESRLPGLRLSRFYCDMYRDDPDPEVRQYLFDSIQFWVDNFNIDGIRLDCANVLDFGFIFINGLT